MENELHIFRKNLEITLEKSQDDFEKQLSFISAGTLGVSMFFIEKVIINLPLATSKWILILSWIFLGFTLIVNLVSHFLCINYNYRTIDEIDRKIYNNFKAVRRNNIIKLINISTLISLILGIILLIIFVSINF